MSPETPFASTRDALNQLLEGHLLTPDELDAFKSHFPEDQYLDYKDGLITSKPNLRNGQKAIRRYVSGFANSEGGTLIVGVTDTEPREISRCFRPGGGALDRWAESLLADMVPKLSPPPRIQVVEHPKGEVLVIAVPRALELVPIPESREFLYYMRLNQSTISVPAFLISDLVLGRRRFPSINLNAEHGRLIPISPSACMVPFHISAENVGWVTAEHLKLGMISWALGSRGRRINPLLMSYIDLAGDPRVGENDWRLQRGITRPRDQDMDLIPFDELYFNVMEGFVFPFYEEPVHVVAALYLISQGAPPLWFELRFTCHSNSAGSPLVSGCEVKNVIGSRARIFVAQGTPKA